MITESQAWRIVAEEYDAGRSKGFLCNSLDLAHWNGSKYFNATLAALSLALREKMVDRIRATLESPYSAAYEEKERGGRILACLLFSEMAKDGATTE